MTNSAPSLPVLCYAEFDTPLGRMIAVEDLAGLCLLEFRDRPNLEEKLAQLTSADITQGDSSLLLKLQEQLNQYFSGQQAVL